MSLDPFEDPDWNDLQTELLAESADCSTALAHAHNDGWFYDDGDSAPNSDLDYPPCPPPF